LSKRRHIGPGRRNELVVVVIIQNLLICIEVSEEADTLNHIWRVLQVLWRQVGIDGHLDWGSDHNLRRRNDRRWNHLLLCWHRPRRSICGNNLWGLTTPSDLLIHCGRRCIPRLGLLCRITRLPRHYDLLLLRSLGYLPATTS